MKRALRVGLGFCVAIVPAALLTASCTSDSGEVASADGGHDAMAPDAPIRHRDGAVPIVDAPDTGSTDALPALSADALPAGSYCSLPGSIVRTALGMQVVGGGAAGRNVDWLTVPTGFCAHHFATVPETRNLRVSPNGDVFASSPSAATAGGEHNPGLGAVVVLPDDDHDGLADATLTFMGSLAQTQGIAFAGGYLYFQDGTAIKRVVFKPGDRSPSGPVTTVTDVAGSVAMQFPNHWPKVFDVAQDKTLYVTNASDQGEACYTAAYTASHPPTGTVFKVSPGGQLTAVAKGFRNPIALRCEADHNVCLIAELARDGSGTSGGREKLVPIRQNDDWGYPCCAAPSLPYADMKFQDTSATVPASDCAGVTQENVAFLIGHTPFGIDFETAHWPSPWGARAFVALHGFVGSYVGSRVVGIALDPATGLPLTTSDVQGTAGASPNMMDFVTGWDDGSLSHGRATAIAFGPDGRMYVGDDTEGEIFWVAPVDLMRP